MTRIVSRLGIATAALVLSAGLALAQTAAPTAPAPDATAPAAKKAGPKANQKKASTPEGIECSAQADAKNLHGKERTAFRNKCKRDLLKAKAQKT